MHLIMAGSIIIMVTLWDFGLFWVWLAAVGGRIDMHLPDAQKVTSFVGTLY